MKLFFYLDKAHYPYRFRDNLSLDNYELMISVGPDSWLCWCLLTYLNMRLYFDCELVDEMPDNGIIFFFRGSVSMIKKPNKNQFWVCMNGDGTWQPYSHVNIVQNQAQEKKYPDAYFARHWPQMFLKQSTRRDDSFQNIYYFGDPPNLAEELKSPDWQDFLSENGLKFFTPPPDQWNDFTNVDAVLAVRSFNDKTGYPLKPSSKLINGWLANAVCICGPESAFSYERSGPYDYIEVKGYEELKDKIRALKAAPALVALYKNKARENALRFNRDYYLNMWKSVIENGIMKKHGEWIKQGRLEHLMFIIRRLVIYKGQAMSGRMRRLFGLPLYN